MSKHISESDYLKSFLCFSLLGTYKELYPEQFPPLELNQVYDRGQRPGERINPVDQPDIVNRLADGKEHQHPHRAPADEHDQHGHHWLSQSPCHGGRRMGEAAQAVEESAYCRPAGAVTDDLRIAVEE